LINRFLDVADVNVPDLRPKLLSRLALDLIAII